jgi:type II secretory pathway component PulF
MDLFHWPVLNSFQRLSTEEAAELAAQVAQLTKAGLPLGDGLRALAGELPGRRLPRMLRALAARLDAGVDLSAAIDAEGRRLPPHLRGLVLAGVRSGRLAEVLEEYVDLQRSQLELRRRVWLSLAYPIVLLTLLAALTIVAKVFIVAEFVKIFRDFGTNLPALTQLFIGASRPGMWLAVLLLAAMAALPIVLWLAPGAAWVWPLLYRVPMIGPLLRWSHLSQFSRLMCLLLEQRVPLPDALRLTAAGLRDADLARACRQVAGDVEAGRPLYESMAARRQFPASLIPVVEWGQRAPALPDAFRAAAEMFEGRAQSHGTLLEAVLLPIVFMIITGCAGVFIVAMLLPLTSLFQMLS